MRKTCTTCHEEKTLDSFTVDKGGKFGRHSKCKECKREYSRQYRQDNPEKSRASMRKSYHKHRDARRESVRMAYQRDAEKIKARQRDYYSRTKEYWSEYFREYRQSNKELFVVYTARRRARKLAMTDSLNLTEVEAVLETFDNKCPISASTDTHLDHFIPISIGHGGTYKGNMIPLDRILNQSKGAKNPFEWAETITEEKRTNFNKVVEYLAEINGLTVEEYREFVYWCFENKREVEDITEENKDSLELWLRVKDVA